MNEVFEKIIEKLEKEKNKDRIGVYSEIQCDAIKFAYGSAKEIVQEVAEEFATDTNVGNNGKWNKKCRYNAIVAKTGEIVPVYECTCSVCGWKTGNQGMRFNYCPNCGAKMDEPYQPKGE